MAIRGLKDAAGATPPAPCAQASASSSTQLRLTTIDTIKQGYDCIFAHYYGAPVLDDGLQPWMTPPASSVSGASHTLAPDATLNRERYPRMSTVVVPRSDVTAEEVCALLRDRLPSRYTITPSVRPGGARDAPRITEAGASVGAYGVEIAPRSETLALFGRRHSLADLGVSVVVTWLVVKLGVDGAVLAESLDR